MRTTGRFALAFLILVSCWASIRAQSLADLAREEEARRKAVKGTARVYTNDDLKRKDGSTAPPPVAPPATPPDTAKSAATTKAGADSSAAPVDPRKEETYWRTRITTVQLALSRKKVQVDALQSRINALTTDVINRDDPAQRSVIERNRTEAIVEMTRLQSEIESDNKEVASIYEEARKASIPAGWLR